MNAFKIIIDKSKVKYLYDSTKLEDGLKEFQEGGFSAVPVIRKNGEYAGTVCDKDFLRLYAEDGRKDKKKWCLERRRTTIGQILRPDWNPAVNISKDINDVLLLSMRQNFLPVVDDMNIFLGIITRQDIIKLLLENNGTFGQESVWSRGDTDVTRKMEIEIVQLQKNIEPYYLFTKMYEAAMKEICIRLETINEMLKIKYNREPLHQIEHRIKSPKSVLGKMAKKKLSATVDNIQENLYDIAGVRVVCAYISDVYEFARYLQEQSDLRLIKRKDYIASPKQNGYRSLHLILEVPINYIGALKMIPVEIQFRTEPMDYWASLEHDLKYKPTHNADDIDISAQLLECSKELSATERKMQNLAELITTTVTDDSELF